MTVRKVYLLITAIALLLAATVIAVLVFLPKQQSTFAAYPKFEDYFAQHPRSNSAASANDRELLEKFRPLFFRSKGGSRPISFYDDYIANGRLLDVKGNVLETNVSVDLLNLYKNRSDVEFVYSAPKDAQENLTIAFARLDKGTFNNGTQFTFLTYNFVFPTSGLAKDLPYGFGVIATLFGWNNDWHQLDHYTAATIAITEAGVPTALLLQQHNHLSTYFFGTDIHAPTEDRPLRLVAALGSNELYPFLTNGNNAQRWWPVVNFLNKNNLNFMLGDDARPTLSAFDVTNPEDNPLNYGLEFLKQDDAFYSFQGFLGKRRRLPGRTGPPGADYNTLPSIKPYVNQLLFGLWRTGDPEVVKEVRHILSNYTATAQSIAVLEKAFHRLANDPNN